MKNIFLAILLGISHWACGQFDSLSENSLQQRVKQLDEFVERFNYHIDHKGNTVANPLDQKSRKKYILALMDVEMLKKADSSKRQLIDKFLSVVCGDSSKFWLLSLKSENWYAQADCKVTFKKKPNKMTLILKMEQSKEGNFRWSVTDLQAPFIDLSPKDSTKFLTPISHELNFMQLAQFTQEYAQSVSMLHLLGKKPEAVSIFYYLVKNKELQIDFVEHIRYHFSQIQGFYFTVKHFERKNGNVGWLIEDLKAN